MNTWKRIALAWTSLLITGLAPVGVASAQVKVTAATPASTYQGTTALEVVLSVTGSSSRAQSPMYSIPSSAR